ncbi:MAG TPA: hypothetical protein VHX88_15080 [Solirubrobacteraceae bacterium]|nr:hypothetical protein [Solirubrobacteraceae bacterium]
MTAASAAPSSSSLLVTNENSNSVLAFGTQAAGDAAPVLDINGAATGLNSPESAEVDATSGYVIAPNAGNDSVTEYSPGANGNVAPVVTISGANTKLNNPISIASNSHGDVYVLNAGGTGSVTEYGPGASGNVTPIATITGSGLMNLDDQGSIAVDTKGNVVVAEGANNAIVGFAPTANGTATPIFDISGGFTSLSDTTGATVDDTGDVFVSNGNSSAVTEYQGVSGNEPTGNVHPLDTISGGLTGMNGATDVAVDPSTGDSIVTNLFANSVTEYTPNSSGNVAPTDTIMGAATQLDGPQTVTDAPVLITRAPLNQTVLVGTSATFNAAANGLPAPTVQWQVSTNGGTSYTNLTGQESYALTLPNVTQSQSGNLYRAVFTASGETIVTAGAYLTVVGEPTISITTPKNGATYAANAVPNSSFTCTKGTNGTITSCTATIDGGSPFASGSPLVATIASHSMTVTATQSFVGSATQTVTYIVGKVPTELTALSLVNVEGPGGGGVTLLQISGTLLTSNTHTGVAGQTISFTAGSSALCSAVTNGSGVASCEFSLTGALEAVLSLGYKASYAGNATYSGTSATGSLVGLLGLGLL